MLLHFCTIIHKASGMYFYIIIRSASQSGMDSCRCERMNGVDTRQLNFPPTTIHLSRSAPFSLACIISIKIDNNCYVFQSITNKNRFFLFLQCNAFKIHFSFSLFTLLHSLFNSILWICKFCSSLKSTYTSENAGDIIHTIHNYTKVQETNEVLLLSFFFFKRFFTVWCLQTSICE